jgi:FSR family fosmidomycin resistance protein-like MFS transporter
MMPRSYTTLLLLGAAHGLNDFVAGALLALSSRTLPGSETAVWFTVYVALAFAAQVPLALVADKWPQWRWWLAAALTLIAAAALLGSTHMGLAVVLSGVASAAVHVAGGAWALQLRVPQGFGAGVFAAPGIVGLTLGGFAQLHGFTWFMLAAVALGIAAALFTLRPPLRETEQRAAPKTQNHFDRHDAFMLLLLLAITLRSAVWDIFQAIHTGSEQVLLGIALAAAAGKITGGWLADKMNSLHVLGGSMVVSLGLLQLSQKHEAFLYSGIALLQATLPASILQVNRLLPRWPAMTNALVLGLAVTLGGFPYMLDAPALFIPLTLTLLLLVAIMWWMKRTPRA